MKKLAMLLLSAAIVCGSGGVATGADAVEESSGRDATSSQAYLGLGVGPLHPALTSHLPDVIGKGRGVLVEQVMDGSPAAKAGMKKYDILVRVNGQDLYSPEQLVKIVRNAQPDSEFKVAYVRGGRLEDKSLTLSEVETREPVRSRRRSTLPLFDRLLDRDTIQNWFRDNDSSGLPQGTTRWETFKSMSISKEPDGKYKVHVEFRDGDKNEISRDYVGTRDEIRAAIKDDKDLPEEERQHLLRSLDKQDQRTLRFPAFDWDSELFNWPNLDF